MTAQVTIQDRITMPLHEYDDRLISSGRDQCF